MNTQSPQIAKWLLTTTVLLLATGSCRLQANEQPGHANEHSIMDASSGPMHDSLASAAADDLIASESSQSPSADAPEQAKAFTSSGQPIRQDPMQQMAASVAPNFVHPPAHSAQQQQHQQQQQQQAQQHGQQQQMGPFVGGLSPHQLAALRQQHQLHHPNQKGAFNPFMAAAFANQQQQQPQMAASYQQPRIMAGAHPQQMQMHPQVAGHPQMVMPGHPQHPQQMMLNPQQQQQMQMQPQQQAQMIHSQQPQHHPHPAQQASPQQYNPMRAQESVISMAESTIRQNVVAAPLPVAPSAGSSSGSQEDPIVNELSSITHGGSSADQATSASSTSTAVAQSPAPSSGSASQAMQSWPLQAPDVPKITNLEVKCEKNLMKVSIEFDKAFNGVIFSKGHYSQGQCVHVGQNSGKQQAYFDISINSCGTAGNTQNGLYGMGGNTGSGTYFENTIVIQYDPNVQEVYDHARKLRCTWHDQYEKAVTFRPFPVDMLDIVRADFAGDNVGCWMQIQVGKGPWASEVAGIVKIGQTMTMVLAIKDEENKFDMLVRNCFAHDGKRGPIELVDKAGCITRPKLMSRFTKIKNFGSSATVLSYAHFQAFKFPDSMEVHFQCTIQICRHQCPDQCSAAGSAGSDNSYTESTISGTMNIHDRQGVAGSATSDGPHRNKLIRERRDLSSRLANLNETFPQLNKLMVGVNRVIQVVSSGDLAFNINSLNTNHSSQGAARQQEEASSLALEATQQLDLTGNQICMSSYNFVLSLVVLCLMLLSSCLCAISLYWRQQYPTSAGFLFTSSSSSSSSTSGSNSSTLKLPGKQLSSSQSSLIRSSTPASKQQHILQPHEHPNHQNQHYNHQHQHQVPMQH